VIVWVFTDHWLDSFDCSGDNYIVDLGDVKECQETEKENCAFDEDILE
jgi:hypothetical protein